MPSSMCRLSPESQFRLSQLTIGKLQAKMLEEEACSLSRCTYSPNSNSTMQSPLCKEQNCCAGLVDAKSRNTSFMISLMDICNKMILPLAALHQDCDTCKEGAEQPTLTLQSKSRCRLCQPNLSDWEGPCNISVGSQHMAGRQTNQHHQPNTTTWEDPGVENDCRWYSGCNNAKPVGRKDRQSHTRQPQEQLQHRKSSRNLNQISNQKVIQKQLCDNNHHPNPGRATQRERPHQQPNFQNHSKTKSQISQRSAQSTQLNATLSPSPELQQPPSGLLDVDEDSGGCGAEAPSSTPASSRTEDDRPLLSTHGVPKWNVTEYQDFRAASMSSNNQVYDPMQHSGTHRHVLILDSQWRLKNAVPNFRVHLYRPY